MNVRSGRAGVLRGVVRAAGWVPVSEIQVYVSGQSVVRKSIEPNRRFEVPLRFGSDAFVTVEVRGEADERFEIIVPRVIPFAFTIIGLRHFAHAIDHIGVAIGIKPPPDDVEEGGA